MYFNSLKTDINRISVTLVDIMDKIYDDAYKYKNHHYPNDIHWKDFINANERYNLTFYDINDKLIESINDVSLQYIEDNFSAFIRYRIEKLYLYYGQTDNITNLQYNIDIDFHNEDELNQLLKQLFVSDSFINLKRSYIILTDGSILEVSKDIKTICSSICNKNNEELSFEDVLNAGALYIFRNTILVSKFLTDAQKETIRPWLSRYISSLNLGYYKDNEYHIAYLTNLNKFQNLYDIVDSIYNDNSLDNIFYKSSLKSCLYNNQTVAYRHSNVFEQSFKHSFVQPLSEVNKPVNTVELWSKLRPIRIKFKKGSLGNVNYYLFPNVNQQLMNNVRTICYNFADSEDTANINALRRYVFNTITKDTINNNNINDISEKIYEKCQSEIIIIPNIKLGIRLFDNLNINADNHYGIIQLLLVAFYLNYYRIVGIYSPYTNKKFINKLIEGNASDINYNEIEKIRNRVVEYMRFILKEYDEDFKETIYNALEEIRNN